MACGYIGKISFHLLEVKFGCCFGSNGVGANVLMLPNLNPVIVFDKGWFDQNFDSDCSFCLVSSLAYVFMYGIQQHFDCL